MMTFVRFIGRVVSDWTRVILQTGLVLEEGPPPITAQADFLLHPITVTTAPPTHLFFSAPVFNALVSHTPVAVHSGFLMIR